MSNLIFQFDYAKTLTDQPHSMIELMQYRKHLILPPSYLGNISSSINNILSAEKSLYSESLKGVLLALENAKLIHAFGTIVHEELYLHCDVNVDILVFKPTKGRTLKGIVNKIKKNSIHFLVHQYFQGSVAYDPHEPWSGDPIHLGQELILEVTSVDVSKELIFLQGKILDVGKKKDLKNIDDEQTSKFGEQECIGHVHMTPGKGGRKQKESKLMEAMLYGCEGNREKDFIESILEESRDFGIDIPVFKTLNSFQTGKLTKTPKPFKNHKRKKLDSVPILPKENPNFEEFLNFASEQNFLEAENIIDYDKSNHPNKNTNSTEPSFKQKNKGSFPDKNKKDNSHKSKETPIKPNIKPTNCKEKQDLNTFVFHETSEMPSKGKAEKHRREKKRKKNSKHKETEMASRESSEEPTKKTLKRKKKKERKLSTINR